MPVTANASPRISVIIPAYKTAHLIAGCLDSVLSQTLQDFEAIVVTLSSPTSAPREPETRPSSGHEVSSWHSWTVMTHGFRITLLRRCS